MKEGCDSPQKWQWQMWTGTRCSRKRAGSEERKGCGSDLQNLTFSGQRVGRLPETGRISQMARRKLGREGAWKSRDGREA